MSAHWPTNKEIFLDRQFSQQYLANKLKNGEITICLGAGASRSLGLPLWSTLVEKCCEEAIIEHRINQNTNTEELLRLMGSVERKINNKQAFIKKVRKILYEDIEYFDDRIISNRLLIALGALIMGSRRGSVQDVITFNFDDVLEWYLDLHGFKTQTVARFPTILSICDARIYHPHGFLPKNENYELSDDIIFTKKSYLDTMGDSSTPWNQLLAVLFISKIVLFVGLSGEDPNLQIRCNKAQNLLNNSRPIGFWLFKENKSEKDRTEELLSAGIVPIYLDEYDDFPKFLLGICQTAAV